MVEEYCTVLYTEREGVSRGSTGTCTSPEELTCTGGLLSRDQVTNDSYCSLLDWID